MSAMRCWSAWKAPIGLPNVSRWREYASDRASAASHEAERDRRGADRGRDRPAASTSAGCRARRPDCRASPRRSAALRRASAAAWSSNGPSASTHVVACRRRRGDRPRRRTARSTCCRSRDRRGRATLPLVARPYRVATRDRRRASCPATIAASGSAAPPAAASTVAASTTSRNGPGKHARPSSSQTIASSIGPSPCPPCALGDDEAEVAHLGELPPMRAREPSPGVSAIWRDASERALAGEEVRGRGAEQRLVVGELEFHLASPCGRFSTRLAMMLRWISDEPE